jgi:asparagine synthetase B (glutamine-hydrolysing)
MKTTSSPQLEATQRVETDKQRMVRAFFAPGTGFIPALTQLQNKPSLSPSGLSAFVHMGFVPGDETLFEGVYCLPGGCAISCSAREWNVIRRFKFTSRKPELARLSYADLVQLGGRVFERCVERALEKSTGPLLIPLSGGMDSRTLLSALLEHVAPRELLTYTYGVPGTNDFEIGNQVAKTAGTQHTIIELSADEHITLDRLLDTAKRTDGNATVFFPVVWMEVLRRFGGDVTVWSGYAGDGVGGSFFQPHQGGVDEAVRDFLEYEARHSAWKAPPSHRAAARCVARETKYDDLLSPHEAIWFENHVERYAAHHIFVHGLRYVAPFMDDEFIELVMSAPPEHRQNKKLFDDIVVERYPKLFSLPTRGNGYQLSHRPLRHALWRATMAAKKVAHRLAPGAFTHPETSYLDYETGLRNDARLTGLFSDLLSSLKRRSLLDAREIDRLWNEHQSGARHGTTLINLASLEVNLQAFSI